MARSVRPDRLVDIDDLRLGELAVPEAPGPVARFFDCFVSRWDTRLDDDTAADTRGRTDAEVAGVLQPALAEGLDALELAEKPGLGVGHSLTATVVTTPRA